MFSSVYKTTLKNLFRSLIFWLAAAFVIGVTVYEFSKGHYGEYDHTLNEMIYDTDPRFVLSYIHYKSLMQNVCISDVMYYAMPIFTVISTVLVLNRDYGDQFFEIEKASGVKAITYTGGRLAALVTVNFALAAIALLPICEWIAYARSSAVAPFSILFWSPFGVKTTISL